MTDTFVIQVCDLYPPAGGGGERGGLEGFDFDFLGIKSQIQPINAGYFC